MWLTGPTHAKWHCIELAKWQKTRNIWMSHFMSYWISHACIMAWVSQVSHMCSMMCKCCSMMAHKVHTHVAKCVYIYASAHNMLSYMHTHVLHLHAKCSICMHNMLYNSLWNMCKWHDMTWHDSWRLTPTKEWCDICVRVTTRQVFIPIQIAVMRLVQHANVIKCHKFSMLCRMSSPKQRG